MNGLKPRIAVDAEDLDSVKLGEQYWQHVDADDRDKIEERIGGIRRDPHALLVARINAEGRKEALVAYIPPRELKHLGFCNYATAGLVLLLENDRKDFARICGEIRQTIEIAYPALSDEDRKTWNDPREWAAFMAGERLKTQIEFSCTASPRRDNWHLEGFIACHLKEVGLSEVDWREIGEHFVTRSLEGAA